MEREFMSTLQGGCAVPIAALAIHTPEGINFKANLFTLDAKKFASVDLNFTTHEFHQAGNLAANLILKKGGLEIVQSYRTGFQL
jgi:hydroxymethylbilane synthase